MHLFAMRFKQLAFAAALIPLVCADAPNTELPVKSLIDSANALLAQGDMHGALDHFGAAIKKDPTNYLTLFKRGATYLSLGKSSQASADFDAVLNLKPDFEAALLQRAKLKAKQGDWEAAKRDYTSAVATGKIEELDAAQKAIQAAFEAEEQRDWEACVTSAGVAILTASNMPSLRSLRAKCRLAKGEVHEVVGDLTHVVHLKPSSIDPYLQMANLLYFSINDFDRAAAQLRKCLHSDPDSKPCSKLLRRIKNHNKTLSKAKELQGKREFNKASKLLVGVGEDTGIIDDVKNDVNDLKAKGYMNDRCPEDLLAKLEDMACEGYTEMNNLKRGRPYCDEALRLNPNSLPGLLSKATLLLSQDLFEEAIKLLETAKEVTGGQNQRVLQKLQEAHTLLRRSKTKDYYKVLKVPRDASDREIKRAYRSLTKQYHPDKYRGDLSKEDVEKKMSSINEAYEVLSNDELRARFDNGDDPNSHEQSSPFSQGGGGHPFQGGFGGQQFMFRQGGGGGNPFEGFGGGGFKFQF